MEKYLKTHTAINGINFVTRISSWESKRLSGEVIKPPTTSNNNLASK